jgi:hypothetical protein
MATSSRKAWIFGVPIMFLVVVAGAILISPAPARLVTISVTATPGTRITGSYQVDGVTSQVDTEAPTEFSATGREVTFAIRKNDQPGEMSVRIATGEGWASATAGPNRGVEVGYRSRGKWLTRAESFWATNLNAAP